MGAWSRGEYDSFFIDRGPILLGGDYVGGKIREMSTYCGLYVWR
jgi:hypothetical protein